MADLRQKQQAVVETSEAQIAVHWREEEYYYPSSKFIGQANLTDPDVLNRFSEDKYPECFREYADLLSWDQYYHTTLDTNDPPFWKWFVGGKINASYNCIDRHLDKYKNKAAIIFVPEPESEAPVSITYRELYVRVNEFAALLRDFCGLKAGDRVTIHMPMVPELPITMLACARLGIIHSVVFGGFSGEACGRRIADSGSHILITMDGYYRNGKLIDHKAASEISLDIAKQEGQVVERSWSGGVTQARMRPLHRLWKGAISSLTRSFPTTRVKSCLPFPWIRKRRCFLCTPAAAPESPKAVNTALAATSPM